MRNLKNLKPTLFLFISIGTALMFVSLKTTAQRLKPTPFYTVGHRGTRGLMPENTIQAMKKAIDLGCNTIEIDIHLTKDGQIIVYHDNSFNPDYTLLPDGSEFTGENRKKYTFYQMNYADIRKFIIGEKKYSSFPQQKQVACYTPLLGELIDSVETYTKTNKLPAVNYLIEIKSNPLTDGFEQPVPEVLVDKMMAVIATKKISKRFIIQSFDIRPLKVMYQKYPKIPVGLLTGDRKVSMAENLSAMGFNPDFYNPYYGMVTPELIEACHSKGMLIVPWTVNEMADMQQMKKLKVDGIITDYPNYFSDLLK
ncbi:glycerophosphodiester phosphodiesterase family protein [Pedobacter cryoconitis]|uniref:Glycerophosphoryl diester phosphodiesterase n=1 Tax=Pedobacter cryoconitis TaxID=188932 RepID=A0A327SJZ4_9SPHI|nr:glycerophosphodiester phosphodiesterase family protein [Pedobacter cryoconitis]RAJ26067.1 glycerophosphoryl diester phosphodiesterase [Pedobacter cryoconitis]